jgi:two-component system sensor histidine kinase AtoS
MSQDVMAQLFEPFITTKQEGSGLGMSISYDIIQAHHGSIAVQSKEGEGATFTVRLPLEQPDCEGPGHDHALRTGRVNRRM